VVEKYGKDFQESSYGTGPFSSFFGKKDRHWCCKNWHIILKKMSKTIVFRCRLKFLLPIDSRSTEFLAFQQGQLSCDDIDPSFKDQKYYSKRRTAQRLASKIPLK